MTVLSPLPVEAPSTARTSVAPVFPELRIRRSSDTEGTVAPFARLVPTPFPEIEENGEEKTASDFLPDHLPWTELPSPPTAADDSADDPIFRAPVFEAVAPAEAQLKPGDDFTDADLFAAFDTLFPARFFSPVAPAAAPEMEPMLRTTIRRALAERTPSTGHFLRAGSLHRLCWHVQALFTSRTYEDILFEKTRRFRIDEVFLFDLKTLSLLSYASCDPARHGNPRRVEGTSHRLALQLRDEREHLRARFLLQDGRGVLSRAEESTVLTILARGTVPDPALADLAYIHRKIEERFSSAIASPDSSVLLPMQSHLEDCLLIQAPAAAV